MGRWRSARGLGRAVTDGGLRDRGSRGEGRKHERTEIGHEGVSPGADLDAGRRGPSVRFFYFFCFFATPFF